MLEIVDDPEYSQDEGPRWEPMVRGVRVESESWRPTRSEETQRPGDTVGPDARVKLR